MSVNYATMLTESGGSNLRLLANRVDIQNWGTPQNSNLPLSTQLAASNHTTIVSMTNSNINVTAHIIPTSCNVFDLGSSNYRFKDLYLSGNTIDIDGLKISKDATTGGLSVTSTNNTPLDTSSRNVYATGNIGIGTTNPKASLHVHSGTYGGTVVSGDYMAIGDSKTVNFGQSTLELVVNGDGTASGRGLQMIRYHGGESAIAHYGTQGFYIYAENASGLWLQNNTKTIIENGNVGIGITNPQQKLHVVGNIQASGTITASNLNIIGDFVTLNTMTSNTEQMVVNNAGTGPALKVIQSGAQPVAEFFDSDTSTNSPAFFIANDGLIGIGTSTPLARAHLYYTGTGGTDIFRVDDDTAPDNTPFIIKEDGKVGIGTTNPTNKLHVQENTNNSTILRITNKTTGTEARPSIIFENDTANTALIQYNSSGRSDASNLTILNNGGPVTIASQIASGRFDVYTGGGAAENLRIRVQSDGNIGIGISTPGEKLHVGGRIMASALTNNLYYDTAWKYYATGYGHAIVLANDGKMLLSTTASSGTAGAAAAPNNAVTIQPDGNVGIGTTAPLAKTHIYYTGAGDVFRVDDATAPDTTPFIIKEDGNIGIGITTPSAKLHVSGDAITTGKLTLGQGNRVYNHEWNKQTVVIGTTVNIPIALFTDVYVAGTAQAIDIQIDYVIPNMRASRTYWTDYIKGKLNCSIDHPENSAIILRRFTDDRYKERFDYGYDASFHKTTIDFYVSIKGNDIMIYAQCINTGSTFQNRLIGGSFNITVSALYPSSLTVTPQAGSESILDTPDSTTAATPYPLTVRVDNVGIGTTNPLAKTHIYHTGSGDAFRVDDATAPDTTPFIIKEDGNVGIGTTNPLSKLHIVGDIQLTSQIAMPLTGWNTYNIDSGTFNGTFSAKYEVGSFNTAEMYVLNWSQPNSTGDFMLIEIDYIVSRNRYVNTNSFNRHVRTTGTVTVKLHTYGYQNASSGRFDSFDVVDNRKHQSSDYAQWLNVDWTLRHNAPATGERCLSLFLSASSESVSSYIEFQGRVLYTGAYWTTMAMTIAPAINGSTNAYRTGIASSTPRDDTTSGWTIAPVTYRSDATNGNVGIGTATPLAKTHIYHTGAGDVFRVDDETAPDSTPFIIKEDGNVGIGTSDPRTNLDVTCATTADYEFPPAAMTNYATTFTGLLYGNGTYNATSSTEQSTGFRSWFAFNKVGGSATTTGWISASSKYNEVGDLVVAGASSTTYGASTYLGEWLQLQLPFSMIVDGFAIQARDNIDSARGDPKDFALFGSADGTAWTQLYSTTNQAFAANQNKIFTVANSTSYSYYRVGINKINGSATYAAIMELRLYGPITSPVSTFRIYNDAICTPYGNVGIGTTNPLYKLHVNNGTLYQDYTENGTIGQVFVATFNANNVGAYSSSHKITVDIGGKISSAHGLNASTRLNVIPANQGGTADFTIETRNSGTYSEVIRLTATGNVGIGTTAPLAKTHIYHTGAGDVFRVDDATAPDTTPFIINQDGNVGIGTTNPQAKLHVVTFDTLERAFPPVGFTNAGTTTTTTIMQVSGSFYGDGQYVARDEGTDTFQYTTYGAWAAMDGYTNTHHRSFALFTGPDSSGSTSVSLQLPRPMIASRYTIYQPASLTTNPKDFQLQGSLDGTTWTNLETVRTGVLWTINETKSFTITNTTAYLHYRLVVTRVNGSITLYLNEFKVYGYMQNVIKDNINSDIQYTSGLVAYGNIGIGTTNPTSKLHVYGAGEATFTPSTTLNTGATLTLQDSGGSIGNGGMIQFGSIFGSFAAIKGYILDGTPNTIGDLYIATRNAVVDATLTPRVYVKNNGNVGIGTSNPAHRLHVALNGTDGAGNIIAGFYDATGSRRLEIIDENTTTQVPAGIRNTGAAYGVGIYATAGPIRFFYNTTEYMRMSTTGNFGIGTTTPGYPLHVANGSAQYNTNIYCAPTTHATSRRTAIQLDDWSIMQDVNGNGTKDFSIYHNSAALHRLFFATSGNVGIGTINPLSTLHTHGPMRSTNSASANQCIITNTSTGYASDMMWLQCARTNDLGYSFILCSSSTNADNEFRVRGDGMVYADNAYNNTGADYSEYFEWDDGNSLNEDRVGNTVVMTGTKIRLSTPSDASTQIIGVVSARPSVVGDGAWNFWNDKYLKDGFGRYILEDYTMISWYEKDENGIEDTNKYYSYEVGKVPTDITVPDYAEYKTMKRRTLNPNYDPTIEYIPREQRKEWAPIGLVGKLRVRKGQVVGDRWIKMRDVNVDIEEWLVR